MYKISLTRIVIVLKVRICLKNCFWEDFLNQKSFVEQISLKTTLNNKNMDKQPVASGTHSKFYLTKFISVLLLSSCYLVQPLHLVLDMMSSTHL